MEWKTAKALNGNLNLAPPVAIDGIPPIASYLIGRDSTVVAWVIQDSGGKWFWEQFDGKGQQGSFSCESAAKLACSMYCNPIL